MIAGAAVFLVGALLYFGPPISFLGRLPGDIRIERPGFRFYFPITSCLVVSAVVSLAVWLFSKLR